MEQVFKGIQTEPEERNRPILKCDKRGNTLHWYKNVQNAAISLGKPAGPIYQCCNGKRKSIYGFAWKYAV